MMLPSPTTPSPPWRLKSAMVLYQLERALGQLLRDTPGDADEEAPTVQAIVERERERGRDIDPTDTASVVGASYLGDLVQLALHRFGDRRHEAVRRLHRLFEALEVHDVRNAIAHPNRDFPECYWHRMAALATDPLVNLLRLPGVADAYRAAQADRIQEPPTQWLQEPTWVLPNNLPPTFEHSLTGLIGRRELVGQVRSLLENPRVPLLAIVGPGGFGKTSLVLDMLEAVVNDRRSTRWADRVVFVSSKVEVLTPEGPKPQDAPSTVEALCAAVDEETDGALSRARGEGPSERIVLCLDNVDTVLTDQAEAFRAFYERLPMDWQVVVTSRVPVDGARTVKVGPLDTQGATKLLYAYLKAKGAQPIRDRPTVARTVEACEANPLAVRLCIDAYAAGRDLPTAVHQTMERILEFSYKNLLSTLSPVATEVLEYLFHLRASATRADIVRGLARQPDEVAEALTSLFQTTLLLRDPDRAEDAYTLSHSVRDLICVYPMDPEVRQRVQQLMRRHVEHTRALRRLEKHRGTTPLDWNHVRPELPADLQATCFEASRVLKGRTIDRARVWKCLQRLETLLAQDPTQQTLRRFLGYGLFRLGDRTRGMEMLVQGLALGIPEHDLDPALLLLLSSEARQDRDYERATEAGEILLDQGWSDPALSNADRAGRVLANALLPKIWLGETAEVIEATADWREHPELAGTLAALHAGALRNSVELQHGREPDKAIAGLTSAAATLAEAARHHGYGQQIVVEIPKLTQQIDYALRGTHPVPDAALAAFTTLVDHHLVETCKRHWTLSPDSPEVRSWLRTMHARGVVFETPALQAIAEGADGLSPDTSEESEWVVTEVYYRPARTDDGEHRRFFFTRDEQGLQYFVDFNSLDDAGRIWNDVALGEPIELLPAASRNPGSAWPAVRARRSQGSRTTPAVSVPCPSCSTTIIVTGLTHSGTSVHETCASCGAHVPVHRGSDGDVFTGKAGLAQTFTGLPNETQHLRALRKQGIRLVEPDLQRALLSLVPGVFAHHGGAMDRDAFVVALDEAAKKEELPATLTDIRKVRNLLFRARTLEARDRGIWALLEAYQHSEPLLAQVCQAVCQRLRAELGEDFDPVVAQALVGPRA